MQTKKKTLKSDQLVVEPTLDGEWSEKVITQIFCSSNHIHMIFITIYQKKKEARRILSNYSFCILLILGSSNQTEI